MKAKARERGIVKRAGERRGARYNHDAKHFFNELKRKQARACTARCSYDTQPETLVATSREPAKWTT